MKRQVTLENLTHYPRVRNSLCNAVARFSGERLVAQTQREYERGAEGRFEPHPCGFPDAARLDYWFQLFNGHQPLRSAQELRGSGSQRDRDRVLARRPSAVG